MVERNRGGEADDAALGSSVGGHGSLRGERLNRGRVDDGSAAPFAHFGNDMFAREECAFEVDTELAIPVFLRECVDGAIEIDPCRVEQDIDTAKGGNGHVDHVGDGGVRADIGRHGQRGTPGADDAVGRQAGFSGIEIGDHDRSAFTCEGFGSAVADADRASSDDDDLVDKALIAVHSAGFLSSAGGYVMLGRGYPGEMGTATGCARMAMVS
ncbi:MAG: hypothetical protein R2848_15280 [Thermomicrobiales bacterium]